MAARDAFYADIQRGALSVSAAVKRMRKLSKLTQAEFAAHRGIGLDALRQIEQGRGNPTVATLDKIASIFGLEVGFQRKPRSKA